MSVCEDLVGFEASLTPIMGTAYGMAWYLTNDSEQAEALLQNVAARAFAAFGSYQPGDNFRAWFLRFLCTEFLHMSPADSTSDLAAWETAADLLLNSSGNSLDFGDETTANLAFDSLETGEIAAAFVRMPKPYRLICALYFLADWSYSEIADLAGCTCEVARIRLHRGRRWLLAVLSLRPAATLIALSETDHFRRSTQFAT
jgi:RNA polymerase sigma-70 factor (ECF subfamily)